MKTFEDIKKNDIIYVLCVDEYTRLVDAVWKSKVTDIDNDGLVTKYYISDFVSKCISIPNDQKNFSKLTSNDYKLFINKNDIINYIEDELDDITIEYNKMKRKIS